MKGKPKPFLRNSEIDELCERLIYADFGKVTMNEQKRILNPAVMA